ncbi:hypothetical protein C8J57DRAFT_1255698 [Mycena rebaudengoi]|nr:hypothetical protein C8J57DRAFT_1255698 [Mycena rebaudengoi]
MAGFTFISENDNFGAPGGLYAATIPPAPAPPPSKRYKKIRFGVFTPGEQELSLNTRSLVSDVRLAQLMVSDSQRALIESMYAIDASNPTPPIIYSVFSTDFEGQLQVSAVMAQHALDVGARDDLSNRWTSQWSEQTGKRAPKLSESSISAAVDTTTRSATRNTIASSRRIISVRGNAIIPFPSRAALLMQK